ncbi:hypothetical protein TraAM80_02603 [Trypanosoma rangeli]|uniref:Uncharacterized protein n=1 Tax=Trypanosoma rangeli TaxID=5698 RepID=A0A3R7NW65_TRYRA|nr:uncharacterized protein TraAM80_02603 [Trypanosoma rangeli]RNF08670.1 hypothetical protein TraAM80_02603 [Trypanosoma rangeli]|eukprot:RNF08670.1 hypothetical protein TraAM80_02603 [Trypanosoma rangeli]
MIDSTVAEELPEHIIQLRQAVGTVKFCDNCRQLEERLRQYELPLAESETTWDGLAAHVRYLEQRLKERQEVLVQLEQDHHTQTLFDNAELREVELSAAVEETRQQRLARVPYDEAAPNAAAVAGAVRKRYPTPLSLYFCLDSTPTPPLVSTSGVVAYALPANLPLLSE